MLVWTGGRVPKKASPRVRGKRAIPTPPKNYIPSRGNNHAETAPTLREGKREPTREIVASPAIKTKLKTLRQFRRRGESSGKKGGGGPEKTSRIEVGEP